MKRHNSLHRFLCLAFVLILPVAITAQLKVTHLTTEHMTNPTTVDELHPRLSWVNEVKNDKVRGEVQTAYRIVVASSAQKLEAGDFDLWDTGKVKDDCSTLIPYNGKPLASGQDCFWKVQTWNSKGKASAWSEPACWGMGLLNSNDWKAQWISAGQDKGAPLFRKAFGLKQGIRQAKVIINFFILLCSVSMIMSCFSVKVVS